MFGYGWSRARLLRKAHIFTPQHAIPTTGLILFVLLSFLNLGVFLITLELYIVALLGLTYRTKPKSFESIFKTIFTFITMHLSWALGYLKGLIL
jgi:hypothetical protein